MRNGGSGTPGRDTVQKSKGGKVMSKVNQKPAGYWLPEDVELRLNTFTTGGLMRILREAKYRGIGTEQLINKRLSNDEPMPMPLVDLLIEKLETSIAEYFSKTT
jgi:hypothetical protein